MKFHWGGLLVLQLMSCGCPFSSGFVVSLYSDMMIALLWPGESTSGTTVMKCAAAWATTALVVSLGPEAAGVHRPAVRADRANRADVGQVGESVDDDAEALIVTDVQMQRVHLVRRRLVDQAHYG